MGSFFFICGVAERPKPPHTMGAFFVGVLAQPSAGGTQLLTKLLKRIGVKKSL